MNKQVFRALIVDHDVIAGNSAAHALQDEGFRCESVTNCEDAGVRLAAAEFDLLVTDLRMPRKHGYSLVREVLAQRTRMVIVVHTRVDIPRLTKDLMARGVDDIIGKPTNYASFAAKLKGRVVRRQLDAAESLEPASSTDSHVPSSDPCPIELDDLLLSINDRPNEEYLDSFTDFLRVSPTAIDVLMMICTNETNAASISQQIKCDPTLSDELIRVSNESLRNCSRRRISTVEEAVARLGTSRIWEIINNQLAVVR